MPILHLDSIPFPYATIYRLTIHRSEESDSPTERELIFDSGRSRGCAFTVGSIGNYSIFFSSISPESSGQLRHDGVATFFAAGGFDNFYSNVQVLVQPTASQAMTRTPSDSIARSKSEAGRPTASEAIAATPSETIVAPPSGSPRFTPSESGLPDNSTGSGRGVNVAAIVVPIVVVVLVTVIAVLACRHWRHKRGVEYQPVGQVSDTSCASVDEYRGGPGSTFATLSGF
jgi:hypothetical protein